jgi:hypothetical protein
MVRKGGKTGKASAPAHGHHDEHTDHCLCEIKFTARDATPDHELPPARGGIAPARKAAAKRRR